MLYYTIWHCVIFIRIKLLIELYFYDNDNLMFMDFHIFQEFSALISKENRLTRSLWVHNEYKSFTIVYYRYPVRSRNTHKQYTSASVMKRPMRRGTRPVHVYGRKVTPCGIKSNGPVRSSPTTWNNTHNVMIIIVIMRRTFCTSPGAAYGVRTPRFRRSFR